MVLVNFRCTGCRQMRIQFDLPDQADVDLWLDNRDLNEADMQCAYCGADMKKTLEYQYATLFVIDEEEIGLLLGRMKENQQKFLKPDEDFEIENFHIREKVKQFPLPHPMDKDECRDYLYKPEEGQFIEEIEEKIRELEDQGLTFPNRERPEEVES